MTIETAWEKKKGLTFLREERQLKHPIRQMLVARGIGNTVIDFGCATAIDAPLWKSAGFKYTGLDFTPKFLKEAKRRNPESTFIEADAADTYIMDGSYDVSFCKDLMEHLPRDKWRSVMREMWRVSNRRMMVAFFIAPTDKPTSYVLGEGPHWTNHYNKGEVSLLLMSLPNARLVEVIENIGFNHSALYVVDRIAA